jgi:hypothetical protein
MTKTVWVPMPSVRNKEGMTAADYAEKRRLYEAADLLRSKAIATDPPAAISIPPRQES